MADQPDVLRDPGRAANPPQNPRRSRLSSPTQQIRAALVEAVCDGTHQPFTDEAIAAQRDGVTRLHRLFTRMWATCAIGVCLPSEPLDS